VAEKFALGYAVSVALFAGVIAAVAVVHFRFGLNAVLSFWLAYIMTRPLGASIGDFMSQNDPQAGGMNLGTTATSYIFLGLILVLVAYLQVTKRDRTTTEVVAADANPDIQFLDVDELDAVIRAIPDEILARTPAPTRRGRRGPAPPPPPDVLGPGAASFDLGRGHERPATVRAARAALARRRLGGAARPGPQHVRSR
jgi:hypothetical protein